MDRVELAHRFGEYVTNAATAAGYDLSPRGGGRKALAAATGMPASTLDRMLTGTAVPSPRHFEALADTLRVPLVDILVQAGVISPEVVRRLTVAESALPVWAQRCSCGGHGTTHLRADRHEPIGPAEVDPFAGHACPLCGDYVTGPCPECAADAITTLAAIRTIAFDATRRPDQRLSQIRNLIDPAGKEN